MWSPSWVVAKLMYEVTEAMLEETYRSSPLAKPFDDFCRRWLEDHCDPEDLALMKIRGLQLFFFQALEPGT
jgi:hemerythrin